MPDLAIPDVLNPAASYGRISDNDGAGPGVGVADQHRRNRKRADDDGLTVTHELTDDDRSAFKKNVVRDDYQTLLGLIRGGAIKYVLVKHADRLHRQPAEAETFIALAQAHGIVVVTASGLRYLLNTADGRKAFRNAATDASFESEHRAERVSEWHERSALAGEYRGSGHRPFGWGVPTGIVRRKRDKKTGEIRNVEIFDMRKHNVVEAAEIQRWADDVFKGMDLVASLRSSTVPTVTGAPWSVTAARGILISPRTSGHSVFQGKIVARNVWDPIIPEDKRQALITIFTDPARRTSPGNLPKWLGSLIYLCGICHSDRAITDWRSYTMSVTYRRGNPVYRCRLKHHCTRQAHPLDTFVRDVIVARLAKDDVADLFPKVVNVDIGALREQIEILEQRKVTVAMAFAADGDAAALAAAKATIDNQITAIQDEISVSASESPLVDFDGVNTVTAARAVWDGSVLARRRQYIRALTSVIVHPVPKGTRPSSGFDVHSVFFDWVPTKL